MIRFRLFLISVVFVSLIVHAYTGQIFAADKSMQLPPAGDDSGVMLEEEYEPQVKKPKSDSSKITKKTSPAPVSDQAQSDESESTQAESHENQSDEELTQSEKSDHATQHNDDRASENLKTDAKDESSKHNDFGEALVEGQVGAKSVSSGTGLIWFGAVFTLLIAFIYLLT